MRDNKGRLGSIGIKKGHLKSVQKMWEWLLFCTFTNHQHEEERGKTDAGDASNQQQFWTCLGVKAYKSPAELLLRPPTSLWSHLGWVVWVLAE